MLALSATLEYIQLSNNLVGWSDGRSFLTRLGLMIHMTAHRIYPGWTGNIVLEMFHAGKFTLILRPKIKITALSFEMFMRSVLHPYCSHYEEKYKM